VRRPGIEDDSEMSNDPVEFRDPDEAVKQK
jgi:hypothetical protein